MVYGLWFMVYGLWFMVYGLWFMVSGFWFLVYGTWFMVYGLWFRVYGLWFRVSEPLQQHSDPCVTAASRIMRGTACEYGTYKTVKARLCPRLEVKVLKTAQVIPSSLESGTAY